MTTEREDRLIASYQDRMLRDADDDFYGDEEITCESCGGFDSRTHRTNTGELFDGYMGDCQTMDCICDRDAPACRWWHE